MTNRTEDMAIYVNFTFCVTLTLTFDLHSPKFGGGFPGRPSFTRKKIRMIHRKLWTLDTCASLLIIGMIFLHHGNVNYVTTAHRIGTKIDIGHGGSFRHHFQALNRKSDEVTSKVKYTTEGALSEVKVKVKGQGHQRWAFSLATI